MGTFKQSVDASSTDSSMFLNNFLTCVLTDEWITSSDGERLFPSTMGVISKLSGVRAGISGAGEGSSTVVETLGEAFSLFSLELGLLSSFLFMLLFLLCGRS